MSEPIEKTSRLSIFVSSLGTWSGLGFGLGLLITAVLAVTAILTTITPPGRVVDSLERSLSDDLIGLVPGTLTIIGDGSGVELVVFSSKESKPVKVSYSRTEDGNLIRLRDESIVERLGRCREARFVMNDSLLAASLTDEYGRGICRWAVDRWGVAP